MWLIYFPVQTQKLYLFTLITTEPFNPKKRQKNLVSFLLMYRIIVYVYLLFLFLFFVCKVTGNFCEMVFCMLACKTDVLSF